MESSEPHKLLLSKTCHSFELLFGVQWLTTFKVAQRLLKGKSTQMGYAHWSLAVSLSFSVLYIHGFTQKVVFTWVNFLCARLKWTHVHTNKFCGITSQSWSGTQLPQVWWWNLKTSVEFSVKSETSCFQQLNHYWYTQILYFLMMEKEEL